MASQDPVDMIDMRRAAGVITVAQTTVTRKRLPVVIVETPVADETESTHLEAELSQLVCEAFEVPIHRINDETKACISAIARGNIVRILLHYDTAVVSRLQSET